MGEFGIHLAGTVMSSEEERRRAQAYIVTHSAGKQDARTLMDALGLLPARKPEPVPEPETFVLSAKQAEYKSRRRIPVPDYCVNGHAFTPENTKYRPEGRVACRTCVNDYRNNLRARKREAAAYDRKKES